MGGLEKTLRNKVTREYTAEILFIDGFDETGKHIGGESHGSEGDL